MIDIKYTTDKAIILTNGIVTDVRDRTAYQSRRGLIHLENCPTVTRMIVGMQVGSVHLTTAQGRALLESGVGTCCATCEKIAARDAAEHAQNEQQYLSEPEPVAESVKPGSTAERLLGILAAEPTRWFRPREIERMWGLKNDAHIRNTFRKMDGVQSRLDDKGALVFCLAA